MAAVETDGGRSVRELRVALEREREGLAAAIHDLEQAAGLGRRLRGRRLLLLGGALVGSFVLAGGVSALVRLALRRGQRDRVVLALGDHAVVRRRA